MFTINKHMFHPIVQVPFHYMYLKIAFNLWLGMTQVCDKDKTRTFLTADHYDRFSDEPPLQDNCWRRQLLHRPGALNVDDIDRRRFPISPVDKSEWRRRRSWQIIKCLFDIWMIFISRIGWSIDNWIFEFECKFPGQRDSSFKRKVKLFLRHSS